MTEAKKLFIRFSELKDYDRVMEFYAANPHKNVADRHEDLIRSLADNGSIILIEDAATGAIVGASISYPLFVQAGGVEQQKWLELGTTRMSLNGYPGLFDVMLGMQVLRAYLIEPPEACFVGQMGSDAVRKMAYKLGFRPYAPSKELVAVSDKTLDIEDGASYGSDNWYSGGPEILPVLAKYIREVLEKPYLQNAKTGEMVELDFSKSSFFGMFKDDIIALADKSCGDPDHPDYTKSIAKHRQEWMRWRFK